MSNPSPDANQPYGRQPYQGQAQPYQGPPPGFQPQPVPTERKRRWFTRTLFLVPLAFILGLIFGSIGGGSGANSVAATDPAGSVTVPGPTTTVTTAGAPGSSTTVTARPEPAPTVTVTQTRKAAPPEPAPTVTVTRTEKAPTAASQPPSDSVAALEDGGTLKVGDDVQPGSYKAKADSDGNCYWARLKDSSGEKIIANDLVERGSVRLTIKKTDGYVETSGCTGWKKV